MINDPETTRSAELQKDVNEHYCCNDYEELNGMCIACKKGYTSTSGKKCEPCPEKNMFGIKCLLTCQCTDNQRCHHVEGCTNLPSTTYQITTEQEKNLLGFLTSASEKTTIYEREKEEKSGQNKGLFTQQIMVYTMCIAGLLVVITICYVCAKHVKNRKTMNGHNEDNNMNRKHEQNKLEGVRCELPNPVVVFHENEEQSERFYDEIEEINVDVTKASFKRHSITTDDPTVSSECENEEKLEDDGYLNPYQQMVNDPDCHDYNIASRNDEKSIREIQVQTSQECGYVDAVSCNNQHL